MVKKIVIPIICILILLVAESSGIFSGLNRYGYDLAFRIRGPLNPPENIIIVSIDDKTLAKLGRWPLSRKYYAQIIRQLSEAEVIALDILLTEPSPDDAQLARAIRKQGRVILPVHIADDMNIRFPLASLSPHRTGHVHIEPGIDGVAREVYHTLYVSGVEIPSISSGIQEMVRKVAYPRTKPPNEDLRGTSILQRDPMGINYCGGSGSFPSVSFLDVIDGQYPPHLFKGKVIIIGITASGLIDISLTPFSEDRKGMAGVEIQANIINTLLSGKAIKTFPRPLAWLLGLLFTFAVYLLFLATTERRGALGGLAILMLLAGIIYSLFTGYNIWLPPALFFLSAFVMFIMAYLFKLDAAAASLNKTYQAILLHLRWKQSAGKRYEIKRGIAGLLTPGGIQSQTTILNDITAQLVFEKELSDRVLLSDIFGVIVFNPSGERVIANKIMTELGAANALALDAKELFLQGITSYILDNTDVGQQLKTLGGAAESVFFTVSFPMPEKRFFQIDASLMPVGDEKYYLYILADITKLKEVEILKGQIVSIVSHELKAPMTSIQGFSEVLSDNLEGQMQKFAVIIHDESLRLAKFVNTFLDINRIEEGRQKLDLSPVLLSELAVEALDTLAPLAAKKGINLRVEVPENVATVMVDRDLTKQCILNLIENAVKYSPADREVLLKVEEADHAVRIDIIDQGYGIREEHLGQIFDKFFRAASEETTNIKGSGLGLSFVKNAVEAQGER